MQRGGTMLASAAALAIAGCGGEGKLTIRSIASPTSTAGKSMPLRIAEAHSHVARGNIGLALETFRKAARENPNSADALAGIAACYDRMGRFDLSRRYYESALALAPGDPHLLGALAMSLDMQGQRDEAARVRSEISARLAEAAPPATPDPAAETIDAVGSSPPVKVAPPRAGADQAPVAPRGQSVTIALPPPRPADPVTEIEPRRAEAATRGQSVTIALPPARPPSLPAQSEALNVKPAPVTTSNTDPLLPANQKAAIAPPPVRTTAGPTPDTKVAAAELLAVPAPAAAPRPPAKQPHIIAQPALRPASLPAAENRIAEVSPDAAPATIARPDPPVGRSVTIALPPPRPAPQARLEATTAVRSGPRIERTSLSEVTLFTAPGPRWKAQPVDRAGPRFVPLREASQQRQIRVLNAARVKRLAARTRSYLAGHGWSRIMIGDAELIRRRSLIVYPSGRHETAARLAAQTGFAMIERPGVRYVTILLGRDAADGPAPHSLNS